MSRVFVIVGLPGSGKTYRGNELAQRIGAKFYDDMDASRLDELKCSISNNEDCVIADATLCDIKARNACQAWFNDRGIEPFFVYFAADVQQCNANIQGRERNTAIDLEVLGAKYDPPAEVIPVWRKDSP